jgi:hypothetical protein
MGFFFERIRTSGFGYAGEFLSKAKHLLMRGYRADA